jgi:hypothetical protein
MCLKADIAVRRFKAVTGVLDAIQEDFRFPGIAPRRVEPVEMGVCRFAAYRVPVTLLVKGGAEKSTVSCSVILWSKIVSIDQRFSKTAI